MSTCFRTLWAGCLAAGLVACIGGAALADDWHHDHDQGRDWHRDQGRVIVTTPGYYYAPPYYYYAPPPPVVYAPPPPAPSIDLVFPIHIR